MNSLRRIIEYAAFPLVLLAATGVYMFAYRALGLPPPDMVFAAASESFAHRTYTLVFLGALGEGLLVVNLYYPGSAMIVLGVVLAAGRPDTAAVLVLIITLTFWFTSLLNYLLGRYGWYSMLTAFGLRDSIRRTQARLADAKLSKTFVFFIHPNTSAVVATSCGILRISVSRFAAYSLGAVAFWNTLWGFLVYYFGADLIQRATAPTFIAVLLLWAIVQIYRGSVKGEVNHESHPVL